MNMILTAALAAIAGLSWNWCTGNQPMSYWLMCGFFIGSCVGADFLEWAWARRRASRRRAHRAAVINSWRGKHKANRP